MRTATQRSRACPCHCALLGSAFLGGWGRAEPDRSRRWCNVILGRWRRCCWACSRGCSTECGGGLNAKGGRRRSMANPGGTRHTAWATLGSYGRAT